jgi:hypothetical protein
MFDLTTSSSARKKCFNIQLYGADNFSNQAGNHSVTSWSVQIPQRSDFVRTGMLRPTRSVTLNDDFEFEKGHSLLSELLKSERYVLGQPPFAFEIAQKGKAALNKLSQNRIQSEIPFDSTKLCLTI